MKSRADVRRHRDAHIPGCRKQYGGTLRLCEPTDLEILSQAQQSEFEKVVKIRNIEKKFAALYRACGKPEPETYRASLVLWSFDLFHTVPPFLPLFPYWHKPSPSPSPVVPRSTFLGPYRTYRSANPAGLIVNNNSTDVKALAGPSQIPTNSSSFLDGFSRPDADTDSTTQQSQTALSQTQLEHNYRQSQTADGADPTLSCADNLQVDQDSAYHSRDHDEPDFEQLMSPYQGFGSSYRGDGSAPLNWFEAHLAGFEHQDGLGEEIEELDLNPCGIVLK